MGSSQKELTVQDWDRYYMVKLFLPADPKPKWFNN